MTNTIDLHENIMTAILIATNKEIYTEQEIIAASETAKLSSGASEDVCNQAIKNIQVRFNVAMDTGWFIEDNSQESWYPMRKSEIDIFYWKRYKKYLSLEKKFSNKVINSIDKTTDEIMDLLGDPTRSSYFKRRGLILGDVQSGKTATYTGICNKAADAGYRVIILLTGTIENLRRQTQSRIDEGFVGEKSSNRLSRKSQPNINVGVGVFDNRKSAAVFTSEVRDFNATLLNSLGMKLKNYIEPCIFVIKKNKRTLENLYEWLKTYNADPALGHKIDLPMLMIDDEADNASVNTRGNDDPTTINRGIRDLLSLFTKANYIGVTATPYANIFINPDAEHELHRQDLFPENFIYALNPPTNYIGNEAIFGDDAKYFNNIESINDITPDIDEFLRFHTKKHYDLDMECLPDSLEKSICYFIIINGIIDIKGLSNKHRTMLINVSRLKVVHSHITYLVNNFIREISSDIDNYCKLPEKEACLNSVYIRNLKYIWDLYDFSERLNLSWAEFQQENLRKAALPIETREINSNAQTKRLNYDEYTKEGARFIAIGGNSLSRGLTLEGLCVSYFYRNSKMYDTLLQMGRWFGYRDGYDELFRIWMTEDAIDWFQYITEATNELKEEIYRMNTYGMTPKDFGLRVRQDISSLMVTARNKMKNTNTIERVYSIAGRLIETPRLPSSNEKLQENYDITTQFYSRVSTMYKQSESHKNALLFKNVDSDIVRDYLLSYDVEPHNLAFNVDAFIRYIKSSHHLEKWDVAFPYTNTGTMFSSEMPVKMQKRSFLLKDDMLLINGTKVRVGSGGCTQIGLSKKDIEDVDHSFRKKSTKKNIPDNEYLIKKRNPLLLVHIIQPNTNSEELGYNDVPLIALGVGFPKVENAYSENAKVKYIINLVAVKKGMIEAEDEGDDYYDIEQL